MIHPDNKWLEKRQQALRRAGIASAGWLALAAACFMLAWRIA